MLDKRCSAEGAFAGGLVGLEMVVRAAGFAVYLGYHGGDCAGFQRSELAFEIVLQYFSRGRGAIHLRTAVRAFHFGGAWPEY